MAGFKTVILCFRGHFKSHRICSKSRTRTRQRCKLNHFVFFPIHVIIDIHMQIVNYKTLIIFFLRKYLYTRNDKWNESIDRFENHMRRRKTYGVLCPYVTLTYTYIKKETRHMLFTIRLNTNSMSLIYRVLQIYSINQIVPTINYW